MIALHREPASVGEIVFYVIGGFITIAFVAGWLADLRHARRKSAETEEEES